MVKRKSSESHEGETENFVPLPVQLFFWRQTSPFIRAKMGKLCDASCVSFERVLVQNILHGLSPSLCEAMQKIPRWRLVQSAFPHVLTCCAAVLNKRKHSYPDAKFGQSETKLLYTLHWVVLDAASECEDNDPHESLRSTASLIQSQLHDLSAIQLFVYLFAPLVCSVHEQDFQTLKLERGLMLWEPLWECRQPDIPCFSTPVKPKRTILKAVRQKENRIKSNIADIFMGNGEGPSTPDDIFMGLPSAASTTVMAAIAQTPEGPPLAPLASISEIYTESISDGSAVFVQNICEICRSPAVSRDGMSPSCNCSRRISDDVFARPQLRTSLSVPESSDYGLEEDQDHREEQSVADDILLATYFDVAVLQCLFCPRWDEDGIYWALGYMHKRLLDICDELARHANVRRRSQSLPVPDINVLDPPTLTLPTTLVSKMEEAAEVDQEFLKHANFHLDNMNTCQHKREYQQPSKKRCEEGHVGHHGFHLGHHHHHSNHGHPPHPDLHQLLENSSAVGNILKPFSAMAGCDSTSEESLTESWKKKSIPSSSTAAKADKGEDNNLKSKGSASSSKREGKLDSLLKPDLLLRPMIIITDPVSETCSEVNESPEDGTSEADEGKNGLTLLPPIPITRSHTDSKISYNLEGQVQEVTGSMHYITEDGCLNYGVVLKAVHSVASSSSTGAGICERILSVLDCLLDLDIVEKKEKKNNEDKDKDGRKKLGSEGTNGSPKKDAFMTVHNLMLDTLFKVYKSLGCPNGCMDSYRGVPTERLRYKGQSIMHRLHHVNSTAFRSYLRESISKHPLQENLDFFHSFLGFCVDPSAHLYSPKGNKRVSTVSQDGSASKTYKKSSTTVYDSPPKSGFATNFGQNAPGSGAKGTEGLLINLIFKPLVTRLVESATELHSHENIGLYCDVRQLMHYIKEVHGGTFRRVALSGLLDSMDRKGKKRQSVKEPKKPILRPTLSNASDSGEETVKPGPGLSGGDVPNARRRRSLFKKKITKMGPLATASDSEAVEDRLGRLSPRLSLSGTEEDSPVISSSSTPKRKFSKFQLTFKKSPKSEGDDDSANETSDSKGDISPKPRMSFKTTGQATLMLLGAKRKVEGGLFGRKRTNKKISLSDDLSRLNFRRTSAMDMSQVTSAGKGDSHLVREKKLVNTYIVKSGMLRFSFLLDCCQPGSIPDPQLIAAILDLEAPVVARACLLLECAYFVQRCNKGDWPTWMKLNIQGFRNPTPLQGRGQPSLHRRNTLMQRGAGRMFHAWGLAIGNRLEALISAENVDVYTLIKEIKDEKMKQELRNNDQEEDFLDESVVNPTGMDCPYALKMLACQVLVEITTFLRETYQFLPRARQQHRDTEWDKSIGRRWSGSHHLGSPNHSQKSASSVQLAESPHGGSDYLSTSPSDRKISFAVYAHDKSDSDRSSASNLSVSIGPDDEKRCRRASQGKKLLRKPKKGIGAQSSIKRFEHNRSIKLKPHEDGSVKRRGSSRRRKVSTTESMKSTEEDETTEINVEEIEDDILEEPDQQNYSSEMPWLKVVIKLANQSNYICEHQGFCHMYCFERQRRSCIRLMNAIQRVYESDESDKPVETKEADRVEVTLPASRPAKEMFKDRLARRRESSMMPTASAASTLRRRDSTPLLERIKVDLAKMKTESVEEKERKEKKPKQDSPMLKYIKTQVRNLTQCPLAIMNKSVPILTQEHLIEMLPVAWELLLESDQEVAAAAATLVLVGSVKVKCEVEALMMRELQHEDTTQRINAILRFHALWRFRYQVWCRLEEGAHVSFKVPPPSIDFTVPSPTIGLPSAIIIDPPWTPHFKAKVEEVTINQDQTKSFVTATSTRRKQQQEMIYKALLAEEDRKKEAREKFPMTTVAIQQQAAYEPALHHGNEEHEEGEEERVEVLHSHQLQMAQPVFPSVICTASVPIIHLLEDGEVSAEGISVCEVAEKVIWLCLVEDPALFLRHFLEKMTNKDKQEELIFVLRKLLLMLSSLPSQTGHILFNYLVGYIMFNVRAPSEGTVESTSRVLSILWMVIPYVDGIFFKDLKQTLKKEQCEPQLMVTANVPSAKKILIHGPDLTSIPSQLPVHEDTQFCTLLQDSLDFFNIPEEQHAEYFLVDVRTNQIHNGNSYVRDFYFFKRNQYPQLSMVHMNPDEAYIKLQMQAIALKFAEVGKVMSTFSILASHQTPGRSHQLQNHVMFVYEELLKLPSFPRKALEAEFAMYKGDHGKEMSSVDSMHKYTWIKLTDRLFSCMTGTFGWSGEIPFFLNVINGALLLQCEDTAMFRFCVATLINAARKFKHIFATDGFLYIMPTIMRVYSNNQNNPGLVRGVQFACKQFFILHRKPFVLQMFGSIASSLNVGPLFATPTGNKIPAKHLFEMLLALEGDCLDEMDILELVEGEKPLKALDFCYADEPDSLTMLECINMCVTVVAYASDSVRGAQMLTILDALLPQYLQHIRPAKKNHDKAKEELNIIMNLGVSMRALITSCDALTRNMSGQQKHLEVVSAGNKPVKTHMGNHLFADRDSVDLNTRQMEEGTRSANHQQEDEDLEVSEYRQPRDSLLCVAAEYYTTCVPRVKELRKQLSDSNRTVELLDFKAHTRLAEIAHTLLKLAPYDPCTMGCRGLQRYMVQVLPLTDWSHEKVRPALHLLLKRLDRMFNKVTRKFTLKQNFDWFSAANLLRGLYLTLSNYPSLAFIPHMKPVINVCLGILLSEDKPEGAQSTQHNSFAAQVPQLFCSSVVKLVAMQMAALGDQYTLEQVCGGSVYTSMEKTQNVLMNFIVPLCIRVGAGRKDCPKVRQEDISYALTIILNTLVPPVKVPVQPVGGFNKPHYMSASDVHNSSVSYSEARSPQSAIKENVFDTAFLGLKVLIVCFPKELSLEWQRIASCIKEIGHKMIGGAALWRFMDFVVTIRSPLFVLLQPFIKYKLTKLPCETEVEFQLQQIVASKVKSFSLAPPKSTGSILIELANELRQIKEELIHYEDSRKSTTSYFNDRRRSTLKFAIVHENQSGLRIEAVAPFQVPGVKRLSKKGPVSRSSSTKTRHSINDESPHWERTPSSKRIKVAEANRILDKFRKDGSEESEASTAAASPTRVLQRQPSVFHTAYIAKQYSVCDELDDILFETLEDLEPQTLEAASSFDDETNGEPSAFIETTSDIRSHRLQRADFKSRKTFKVKRMGTKAFSRRSQNRDRERVAAVAPETIAIAAEEVQPTQVEMQELKEIATECVTEQVVPETVIQEDRPVEPLGQFSLLRKRGSHGGSGIISSPVLEDIPEGLQQRCSSLENTDKIGTTTPRAGQSPLRMAVSKSHTELHGELTLAQSPPKGRYKRSRSTENILDASRSGAPSGARSRIARQLGKLGLQSSQSVSRSPSISPRQSPARESDPLQRYSSAESIQSITSNEGASLLKKESKIARSANHGKGMDSTRI